MRDSGECRKILFVGSEGGWSFEVVSGNKAFVKKERQFR